jgi:hypothetical protein
MSRTPFAVSAVVLAVSLLTATATWVYRDALSRGLPRPKARTWAALQLVQWPLFYFVYRYMVKLRRPRLS